jgi:hypothetical protein
MRSLVFYAAILASLSVPILVLTDHISVSLVPSLIWLGISLGAFTLIVFALSAHAARRYFDHVYGAPFSRWSYLVPSGGAPFNPSSVEALWKSMTSGRWHTYNMADAVDLFRVLMTHLFTTALYGVPVAALLPRPWLTPLTTLPLLLLFYWLPQTELCGEHTTRLFLSTRRYLRIYQDPESRHWVLPRNNALPNQGAGVPDHQLVH